MGGIAVTPNPYSWNLNANIIFIDQPAGTGFSTPGKFAGYVHDEQEMATEMYKFLQGWLSTFPEYIGRPFYIFGESYAGSSLFFLSTQSFSFVFYSVFLL